MVDTQSLKAHGSGNRSDWRDLVLAVVGLLVFGSAVLWIGIGNRDDLVLVAAEKLFAGPQALLHADALTRIDSALVRIDSESWLMMPVIGLLLYLRPLSLGQTRRWLAVCALVVVLGWMVFPLTLSLRLPVLCIAMADALGATVAGGLLLSTFRGLGCARAGAAGTAIATCGGILTWFWFVRLGHLLPRVAEWHVALGMAYLCGVCALRVQPSAPLKVPINAPPRGNPFDGIQSQPRVWLLLLAWCALAAGIVDCLRLPRWMTAAASSHPCVSWLQVTYPIFFVCLCYPLASRRLSLAVLSRTLVPVALCVLLLSLPAFGLSPHVNYALRRGLSCWIGLVLITLVAEIAPPRMEALVYAMAVTVVPAAEQATLAVWAVLYRSHWGSWLYFLFLLALICVAAGALKAVGLSGRDGRAAGRKDPDTGFDGQPGDAGGMG